MKKIRFATIGLGRMGRGHINEILSADPDRYELVAVCDHAPDRLENLPESWGNSYAKYASLDELLADEKVDLVTAAVRHMDHVPFAKRILEAGKYCMTEKPIATSVAEMKDLIACGQAHPGKLFLRHNRRFEPEFTKAKQLMDSGLLGDVQYITINRSVGYCRRNDWMTMSEFYGGLLTNWGPHMIDQALQFLESPVVDIWADVRHSICIGDSDDLYKILLKGANGRLAEVQVTGANTLPGRELEIIGTRGTLAKEANASRLHVRMVDPSIPFKALKPHPENPPHPYGKFDETLTYVDADYDPAPCKMTDIWKHCADSILNGAEYPIRFEEALEVVRVTEEVYRKSGFAPMQKFLK